MKDPATEEIDLSIVMPCLNEAETVGRCVDKALKSLEDLGVRGEVLVADNGSADRSPEIAARHGARVISVPRKGYGNALRAGIEAARGRWIVMGDADDSYDFSNLGPFVEQLQRGFDLVMGCRLPAGGGTIVPGAMPWKHRWIGNPGLSFIGRLFFRCPVTDFYCGLRAFTSEAYRRLGLQMRGMEFALEMVIKSTLLGLSITEVPITLFRDGRSHPPHLRTWRDGWRSLRFMLLFSPRWLFLWPGLILLALGLAGCIALAGSAVTVGRVVFDANTLLVSAMMLIVGFQVTFFALAIRSYCFSTGLLPASKSLSRILRLFTLERGIVMGALSIVAGAAFLIAAVLKWKHAGFGQLSYPESLRLVIPAITLTTLGVQVVFSSFFLSILTLERD